MLLELLAAEKDLASSQHSTKERIMAKDYARYMYEQKDVMAMYSDGGKWSWDNGRQQGAYMRADGSPLQQESAAEYAANHYRNFGQREGRQLHETGGTDYAALLRGSNQPAAASPSPQNDATSALQKQISELTQSLQTTPASTEASRADASQSMTSTILTSQQGEDKKKKKSFLTPLGA